MVKSHGFYRFLSWECILWLFTVNYPFWFAHPFRIQQIFSWLFLILSGFLVIIGAITMKKKGNPQDDRDDNSLYKFERTSKMIDQGIFKYIRHPLYASLLCLTWGIYLKNPTAFLLLPSGLSTVFLYITARIEEKECFHYFGPKYTEYMKHSKMFIPFIL
jgi:protein-S-isoprenylcysteine O-methyltransferase Ste14